MLGLKKTSLVSFYLFVLLIFSNVAHGETVHELDWSKNTITVEWTCGDDKATYHELRYRMKEKDFVTPVVRVNMPAQQATLNRPRSGHFTVEIQACNSDVCSGWVTSLTVGLPSPWSVYWKPPKPSNVIVDDY